MLTGKNLGVAIASAIKLKGVSKAAVARHFNVKPPSISDWCDRGPIKKDKLTDLFDYFADVVGPAHWGLSRALISSEPPRKYNVTQIAKKTDPFIAEAISIMEATDAVGRQLALAGIKVALRDHKPTKAKRAS